MLLTIITAYLILLTVMSILRKFFKVDKSMLFCGIFAFSGKKDLSSEEKKIAFNKFKMLGLYNQSRGIHGCGIYINGEVIKNAGANKLFNDFIANNVFEEMTDNHTLIGHCRQMSRGGQTEANTHPFKIEDDLVGVHNGTIENIWDLCKEAGITRNHSETDSQALFEIIQKDGIDVLEKYKGGAALLWTRVEEDNVLYVYHGASKTYKSQIEPAVERPLFYLETAQGVFFSSLENSLFAIRDTEEDIVFELPTNVVYTLQNGEWLNEDTYIDREEANVPAPYIPTTTFHQQGHYPPATTNFARQKEIFEGNTTTGSGVKRIISDYSDISPSREGKLEPTIWRETRPSTYTKGDPNSSFVYFYKGRHYTNANVFARGKMNIAKGGIIHQLETKETETYWFFDGVMMKNEKAYDEAMKLLTMTNSVLYNPSTNFALVISAFSKYPVTNSVSDAQKVEPAHRYKWYQNGFTAKEGFTPKFSPRHYKISMGILTDVASTESGDEIFFSNFSKTSTETNHNITDKAIVPFSIDAAQGKGSEASTITGNDPIFDIVYPDFDNLLRKIDKVRMLAMMKYVSQEREATHLDMDNEELHIEVSDKVLKAVAMKTTIRLVLEDRYALLEELMNEAREEINAEEERAVNFRNIESNPDPYEERDENDREAAYAYYEHNYHDDYDEVDERAQVDELIEEEEKDKQLDEANDLMDDVVELLKEVNEKTDELQVLEECDCAQEFASVLYKGLTSLKYNLQQVCEDQKNEEVANKINNAINI